MCYYCESVKPGRVLKSERDNFEEFVCSECETRYGVSVK